MSFVMTFILNGILEFLASPEIRLIRTIVFFLLKGVFLFWLLRYRSKNEQLDVKAANILLVILFSVMVVDCYTILFAFRDIGVFCLSIEDRRTLGDICWIAHITFHLGFFFLIRRLLRKSLRSFFIVGLGIGGVLLGLALVLYSSSCEIVLWRSAYFYILMVAGFTLFEVFKGIRNIKVPLLLRMQLKILTFAFVLPIFGMKFCNLGLFIPQGRLVVLWHALFSIATALLIAATYYCATRLVRIRFLNIKYDAPVSLDPEQFKKIDAVLTKFERATATSDFRYVVSSFFSQTYHCAEDRVRVVLFDDPLYEEVIELQRRVRTSLEAVPPLVDFLDKKQLFARSEIEFSWYHEEALIYAEAIQFLDLMGADLFVPLFDRGIIAGFVMVESRSEGATYFSLSERAFIAFFARILGSAIRLVRQQDYNQLLSETWRLKEEAYFRHQELAHFREGVLSFSRRAVEKQIGVLFYKRRKYAVANRAAELLLGCDPNRHHGHPLVEAMGKLVNYTMQTRQYSSSIVSLHSEMQLSVMTFPGGDEQEVVVVVSRPEISDLIDFQKGMLKDPAQWDYILYLETTEKGRRVGELLPGVGATILQLKIDLLRLVLCRNALCLTMAKADCNALVSLIHEASLRKQFSVFSLREQERGQEYALRLFGVTTLFGEHEPEEPLLVQFEKDATLFIENVQFLALATQKRLAEFLSCGAFKRIGGSLLVSSDVRIIFSSDRPIDLLFQDGVLAHELFRVLKETSFILPQPSQLPYEEFVGMVDSIVHLFLTTASLKKVLGLTEREQQQLWDEQLPSIDLLKKRVYALLQLKAAGQQIELSGCMVDANDEQLHKIVMLGARALKDQNALAYLWNKFQCQAKIASILGVNKSSVSRRCKAFGLEIGAEKKGL